MSGMAHFFMSVCGSKFHERLAHFFIDIYTVIDLPTNLFYGTGIPACIMDGHGLV